ncbi:MAG: anthranilate phosphoribosyltransferase [Methanocellales archaeon]|nr:anthranilate phosphoribosyltransferase [Methanocellales archaeon]MDD4898453.1 anthranilate phosphoribosyltransferase [Methanocellales archaeon]MDD5447051.1 anthranilate phosphoribosyltransferase [Methanocellales archaeon]
MIERAISKVIGREDLSEEEARKTMEEIMSGRATNAQIAAFLTGLRLKGEKVEEIAAFARVMREFCSRIEPQVKGILVDTCGTGGDRLKTFNISTASALVAAGAGIPIAKHGNRSVTSKCGSADVLEMCGVNIGLEPKNVEKCIERIGFGFMFAPMFHGAMKYATPVRKEIGIRTVFNILGPLTNPAGARAQVLGVYDTSMTELLANVLKGLGTKHAMVVHGLDGLDEISTVGETRISELCNGNVNTYTLKPEDIGFERAEYGDIMGHGIEDNVLLMIKLLNGGDGPRRDVVLMNAAAAIMVGGKAENLEEGVEIAVGAMDSGRAYDVLRKLIRATDGDPSKLEGLEAKL